MEGIKKKKSFFGMDKSELIFFSFVLIPVIIQFIIFYCIVNFNSIVLAFKEYAPGGASYEIVWFKNVIKVIKDFKIMPELKIGLKNSLTMFGIQLLIGTTLALLFSYYIFKKYLFSSVFRLFLFLPQVISSITMVIIYKYTVTNFIPTLVNSIFKTEIVGLLDSKKTLFPTLAFYSVWIGFGTSTLLYVGAMTGISESIMEASKLDGTGFFREFFQIVFPQIFPTFSTFFVMGLAGSLVGQFDIYSFFSSGADPSVYNIGYYMYIKNLEGSMTMKPYLSSMGVLITIIVAPITLGVRWLFNKLDPLN